MDSYLADMAYLPEREESVSAKTSAMTAKPVPKLNVIFEARAEGEMDIQSLLALNKGGDVEKASALDMEAVSEKQDGITTERALISEDSMEPAKEEEQSEYDAREDFKYVLTQGPRLGYHFVMVCTALQEIKQNRIKMEDFKHKIMFRAPKQEAVDFMNAANAEVV